MALRPAWLGAGKDIGAQYEAGEGDESGTRQCCLFFFGRWFRRERSWSTACFTLVKYFTTTDVRCSNTTCFAYLGGALCSVST